jgi:magnesium-transporting ATPase (P-type)
VTSPHNWRAARRAPETEFERGTRRFSLFIMQVVFVFVVSAARQHDALESLLFAVALAVGLTPEFLPMITTITLSQGAVHMARRKVIVKNLAAIQNFGRMDVLCSDKTGTLTSGDMTLDRHTDPLGKPSPRPLALAYLNSFFETGSVSTAVDVAKSAADIILLERGLGVLHSGLIEGRKAFGNVDPSFIHKPCKWDIGMIRRFMVFIGPISSLFDFLTFAVMWFVFRASEPQFHTGWFVESLATQTLVLFVIRTLGNPLRSRPSRPLAVTTLLVVLVGLLLPISLLAGALGFTPLPAGYFLFLVAATGAYLLLVETVKRRVMGRMMGD